MLFTPGILGLPSWQDFQPFLVTGLSLGGVYALSGVGIVVLYRATGVLNLAFGAVGAMGALIAWSLINHSGWNEWLAYAVCVLFGGVLTLFYGMVFGPALAKRDPLVKATATLGLTLILLGVMDLLWTSSGGASRSITLPTDNDTFMLSGIQVEYTNVIALVLGFVITVATSAFLRYTKLGDGDAGNGQRSGDHRHAWRAGEAGRSGGVVRVRHPLWNGRHIAGRPGGTGCHHTDVPGHIDARRDADRATPLDTGDVRRGARGRDGGRVHHPHPVDHELP